MKTKNHFRAALALSPFSLLTLATTLFCVVPVADAVPIGSTSLGSTSLGSTSLGSTPLQSVARSAAKSSSVQKTPTRVSQGDARLARIEALILNHVNTARSKAGLNALTTNSTLAEVARAHSVEMRDKSYFAHESPTPELRDPLDRFLAVFNSSPRLIAENIFRSWGSRHEINDNDALKAHTSLMNSPGHRANILRASVTQIGIGVIANENGDLWVTQNFIRP